MGDPTPGERAFSFCRRIVVFILGVVIICFALIDPESMNTITMLLIGMVMVGVLPLDNVLPWNRRRM
jgi:hypothetical protein